MKSITSIGIIFLGLIVSAWADGGEKERDRITASANVVKDIFNAPDERRPAQCSGWHKVRHRDTRP